MILKNFRVTGDQHPPDATPISVTESSQTRRAYLSRVRLARGAGEVLVDIIIGGRDAAQSRFLATPSLAPVGDHPVHRRAAVLVVDDEASVGHHRAFQRHVLVVYQ